MERLRKSLGSFIDDDDIECYVSAGNLRIWDQDTNDGDGFVVTDEGNGGQQHYFSYVSWSVVLVVIIFGGMKLGSYILLVRSRNNSKEKSKRSTSGGPHQTTKPAPPSESCFEHPVIAQSHNVMSCDASKQEAKSSSTSEMEAPARYMVTQEITVLNNNAPQEPNNSDQSPIIQILSSIPCLSDESAFHMAISPSLNPAANMPDSILASTHHMGSLDLQDTLLEASKVAQTIQLAQVVFDRHGVDRNIASMWALKHQESQRQRDEDRRKEMDRRVWDAMQRNTEQHLTELRHQETLSALRHDPNLMDKIQSAREKCWNGLACYCFYYIPLTTVFVVGTNHRNVQFLFKLLSSDSPVHKKAIVVFDSICKCKGSFSFVDDFPFAVREQCHSWLFCSGIWDYLASSSALFTTYGSCFLWIGCFFGLHRVLRLLSMPPAVFHIVNLAPMVLFWGPELVDIPIRFLGLWIGPQVAIAAWFAWMISNETGNVYNTTPLKSPDTERTLSTYSIWDKRIRQLPNATMGIAVAASLYIWLAIES